MPNWCSNTLYVSHPDAAKISALVSELQKEKPEPFNLLRPMPPEFESEGWYQWRVGHWGTKWDACDPEIYEQEPNRLCVHFMTAWSPPIPLYDFMKAEGYQIDAAYSEDGMCFRGTYTNDEGDFCEEYNPDEEEGEFE
jgi:hypothetical protein